MDNIFFYTKTWPGPKYLIQADDLLDLEYLWQNVGFRLNKTMFLLTINQNSSFLHDQP
jgi:hypothetical protein